MIRPTKSAKAFERNFTIIATWFNDIFLTYSFFVDLFS